MTDIAEEDEVICDCTGTKKAKVVSLIKQGADYEKITSATGACTGCGSCDVDVINLVEEHSVTNN